MDCTYDLDIVTCPLHADCCYESNDSCWRCRMLAEDKGKVMSVIGLLSAYTLFMVLAGGWLGGAF